MADVRLPKGSECQCMHEGCGLCFEGEPAFKRHFPRGAHVEPAAVGLVEKMHVGGPVWGLPGDGTMFGKGA